MTTLHIINKLGQPLTLCQRSLAVGDGILLIEDGVYLLGSNIPLLSTLIENYTVHYLDSDRQARGIPCHNKHITAIDYSQFVELTAYFQRSISWF